MNTQVKSRYNQIMDIHLIFDMTSYITASFISYQFYLREKELNFHYFSFSYGYYISLMLGILFGAFGLGTLNMVLTVPDFIIGKSVIGALCGAILAVEIYKKIHHIRYSTGAYFVPALAFSIAIGRLGCFFAGIDDHTFGVETDVIWGYDFGDGIKRHPVQLYESLAMICFFGVSLFIYLRQRVIFQHYIFYIFTIYYGLQRFIWEFLKPYGTVIIGLNIFHLCSLGLIMYGIFYIVFSDKIRKS